MNTSKNQTNEAPGEPGVEDPHDEVDYTAIEESGLLGKVTVLLGNVFAFCFILSMAILLMEVVLRYAFDSPTLWAHETTTFLTSVGFIFGGLYAVSRDKHIRVVLIYDAISPRLRKVFNIIISLVCGATTCVFSWAAWKMVERSIFAPTGAIHFERSGSAWNPPFPAWSKLFLFSILVLMTIQFLILAWNYARKQED